MSKHGGRHIAVHINELVLPRGSRMPDQAALRRMVEAEVQRRLASNADTELPELPPTRASDPRANTNAVALHIQQKIKGAV